MDIKKFKKLPILGILRGIEYGHLEALIETVISAGLQTIEITMNTNDAPRLIKHAVALSKGRLAIGAGTVLDKPSLKIALDNGATFIVMPVLIRDIADSCLKAKIHFFPGALTPQEIYNAHQAGATMVKVFPASCFGPSYFKEIKGPLNEIPLLACGGITPDNMKEYFSNGAAAIAFGASVFRKEWLAQGDFKSIRSAIESFTLRIPR